MPAERDPSEESKIIRRKEQENACGGELLLAQILLIYVSDVHGARLTVGRDQRASEGIFVIKCVASRFPSHGHADPLPKYAAAASVKIPHEHADRAGLLCGLEKFLVPHIDRIPASDV
ncbi:MAG TPA: hypothetical protein DEF06_13875 [Clostridiales bacterium]|nr:hypothetical protein [Clostridiales bacterium]